MKNFERLAGSYAAHLEAALEAEGMTYTKTYTSIWKTRRCCSTLLWYAALLYCTKLRHINIYHKLMARHIRSTFLQLWRGPPERSPMILEKTWKGWEPVRTRCPRESLFEDTLNTSSIEDMSKSLIFERMYIRQPWAGCLIPLAASHETHGVSFIEESDAMFFSSIYEVLHTQLLNSRRFDGWISRRYGLQ